MVRRRDWNPELPQGVPDFHDWLLISVERSGTSWSGHSRKLGHGLGHGDRYLRQVYRRRSYPGLAELDAIVKRFGAPAWWADAWKRASLLANNPALATNPFAKWVYESRARLSLTRQQLADLTAPMALSGPGKRREGHPTRADKASLPLSFHTIEGFERGKFLASRRVVMRLESVLGPGPYDVVNYLREERGRLRAKAGKHARKRVRDRVYRWKRQRLSQEVERLLGQVPPHLLDDVPPEGPVRTNGFRAYSLAVITKARNAVSAEGRQRGLSVGRQRARGTHPRRVLAMCLWQLEQGRSVVFQCVVCGDLAHTDRSRAKRYGRSQEACRSCWLDYYRHSGYMEWVRSRRSGDSGSDSPPPPLSRRSGPIIHQDELARRLVLLLKIRLGKPDDDGRLNEDYEHASDIERRLTASPDPWCQRITNLSDRLARSP
jgi:hypothetical protein